MIREIQEKQFWLKDILLENQESKLNFIGRFDPTNVIVEDVARDIRNTLGIVTDEIGDNALKYWITKVEARRIFVSLSSNYHTRLLIDIDEASGFAIADTFAPFIFLNSRDYVTSQLFTLAHELGHLWINESGISNDTGIEFRNKLNINANPIEIYCNAVAANVLIPKEEFIQTFRALTRITYEGINSIAKHFGVSNLALLIRSLNLGLISDSQFTAFKKEADRRFQEYLQRESELEEKREGAPNYYLLQMRRNGKAFSQIVFDFYKGGQISGLEASNLLNVKINNFPKLEQYIYQ